MVPYESTLVISPGKSRALYKNNYLKLLCVDTNPTAYQTVQNTAALLKCPATLVSGVPLSRYLPRVWLRFR